MSFSDKVVIVTGASSGIGAAIAIAFAKEGALLVIVGRNEAKLKNIAEKIRIEGKEPLVIKADVSKDKEAKSIIDKTIEKYGKLDILINNAGFTKPGGVLEGKVLAAYDEVMGTNLRAVVHLTMLAAPHLIQTKGNIVNMSSVCALTTPKLPELLPYHVSKAALDHFMRGVALELAPHGVRVNNVNPGPVDTEFLEVGGVAEQKRSTDNLSRILPLGKVGGVDEIAELVLYVASDKARSVTGSYFLTDNGMALV